MIVMLPALLSLLSAIARRTNKTARRCGVQASTQTGSVSYPDLSHFFSLLILLFSFFLFFFFLYNCFTSACVNEVLIS